MDEEVLEIKNYINGEFVATASHIISLNPATGKPCARVPDSGSNEIDAAVIAAKNAFYKWSTTSVADRVAILFKIADLIEKNAKELALFESIDQGKPLWLSETLDIPRAVHNFRHFATVVQSDVDMAVTTGGLHNYTVHEPIGVVGLITPWNLPLYLLTFKLAPALAYGTTVVAKPSEMSSITAFKLCELMHEAGIPPGVVNMVFGDGPKAGEALVDHKYVPLISFTGGTKTGIRIAERAARLVKKLSLELGGKNPAIVFKDANLKLAVSGLVRASFLNQGEVCLCATRIYVERELFDEFLQRFVAEAKQLKVGDPLDKSTFVGPLISRQHLEKVKGYVDLAKAEGAIVHCGASFEVNLPVENQSGFFFPPTIISHIRDCSRCVKEEIFGPFVCVFPFDTEEEALRRAHDTDYGLSATVWSQNVNTLHRVAGKLKVGTVWCNTWLQRNLHMPFGGRKMSGIGREGTFDSRDFFCAKKTICVQISN